MARSSSLPAGCSELMFLLVRLVTVVTAITATIAPSYLQFYTQTYAGHQCHCKFRNRALDTWGLIVLIAFKNKFILSGTPVIGIGIKGRVQKKKSMEISIRGGGVKPIPHFFFLYPQFIQKCIKKIFYEGGVPPQKNPKGPPF